MSMLGSGSECPDYEPLPKKLKSLVERQDSITDAQAHLEPTEEAALKTLILDRCSILLNSCKKLSDELYRKVLDGFALFFYLLYDKDDLRRTLQYYSVYEQRSKFWEELEPKCESFVKMRKQIYEACKWIVHKNPDLDRYSILNEYDLGSLLMSYDSCSKVEPYVMQEFYDYDYKECVKSAMDDDIQKAIKNAQSRSRFSVDKYTSLLLEMVTEESTEYRDALLKKAVENIDSEAFCGLDVHSVEDLIVRGIDSFDEFYGHINIFLWRNFLDKKLMVQKEADCSAMPFFLLFFIVFFRGPLGELEDSKVDEYGRRVGQTRCVGLFELIKVAELRRKAEGSRFIKRDHFLWAFEKSGWGLRTAFKEASRNPAEGHDHPPYHIYMTAFMLAQAEEITPLVDHFIVLKKFGSTLNSWPAAQEPVEADHLAFAVIFAEDFVLSEEEVIQMREKFKGFRTALRVRCADPLKDWSDVPAER